MDKYGYSGDPRFRPISPWGYFGYSILFAIPFVGLIVLIVLCFNDSNINRRCFARSFFCWVLIAGIILLFCTAVLGVSAVPYLMNLAGL